MAIEVECKVRVHEKDIHALFSTISSYMKGREPLPIDKKDAYYSTHHDTTTLFRIRRVGDESILTRKVKEKRSDGIEVNEEIECTLPYQSTINPFFESLGYRVVIEKEKKGWSWIHSPLTIELVEVAPLGWFVEIEVIVKEDSEKEEAIKRLKVVREELGIDNLELVYEYYNDMLKKIRK